MKRLFIAGCAFAAAVSVGFADAAWKFIPNEDGKTGILKNDDAVGRSTGWELNARVRDANKRTLAIGNGQGGDAYVLRSGVIVGGAVLDLSEPIADVDGNAWTIDKFDTSCFRRTDAPTSPARTFVAPKELVSIVGKIFDYEIPSGEKVEATFDCPNLTGLPNGTSGKPWVTLHLKVPSCAYIDQYALTSFAKIDVSEWDLSGVQDIGLCAFAWPNYPTGTLRFPLLRTIGARALGMAQYKRLEWGNRYNTLTRVGEEALNTSCEELVLGCADGCTFAKSAVNAGNLTRVWMTGAVPVFATDEIAFGVDQGERTMVFYVPDTDAWAAIRAAAAPLAEDEIAAFKTAHPDWEIPFGVVGADVFRTKNAQYVGTADLEALGVMSRVEIKSRSTTQYGDAWEIAVDGEISPDGVVRWGADVTVTAKPAKDSTVVLWEGELPDGTTPTGKSFSFKAKTSVSLYAVFAHAWEYDADAATISDGYWTLPTTVTAKGLALGAAKTTLTAAQAGELNLAGPIYTKGSVGDESARWSIVELPWQSLSELPAKVTSFYAPTTLTKVAGQLFNGVNTLENLVFDCPDLTGNFGDWGYMLGGSAVPRIVLNVPKLASVGQSTENRNFWNVTFSETELSEWDLTGLKTVRAGGFGTRAETGGPKGDLALPNVEEVMERAFDGWTRVSSIAFGTNGTLKSLGKMLFWNPDARNKSATGPRKLDFGASWDFTVDPQAFYSELPNVLDDYPNGQPLPIKEVWFSGKAPSRDALDGILALQQVAEDGTKPVKIYATMREKTWRERRSSFTVEEAVQAKALEDATGERYKGVYETQDGRRVAWIVHNPNCRDRTGLSVLIK